MKAYRRCIFLFFGYVFIWLPLWASDNTVLRVEGEFLAYSYDLNQILGRDVTFLFAEYAVSSRYLKIDIGTRTFYAYGSVILKKDEEVLKGDEFLFQPDKNVGNLIVYGSSIELLSLGEARTSPPLQKTDVLDNVNLHAMQTSLIYWTCPIIEIDNNMEVFGYRATLYLEGMESLVFKKFKLSGGLNQRRGGFSLEKIWYTRNQGIIGRGSFAFTKENRVNSLTRLHYEERSVLKTYQGPERQVDLMHATSITLSEKTNLGFNGNYNSSNLWNTSLWLNRRWSRKLTTNFNFSYNKPVNYGGETWLGLQSTLNTGKGGNISFLGKYEFQNQLIGNVSYNNLLFDKVGIFLTSTYSKVKTSGSADFSEILSSAISVSHRSKVFNLSTDYYLNYDLMGSQLLSQPQLRLGLNPISFYRGLLSVSLSNIFIYNNFRRDDSHEFSFSNNSVLSLSSSPIYIRKSLNLNVSVQVEQFLEREGRNFSSGGFIFNVEKEFLKGFLFELYYNIHSRRRTRGWLIEGTTSQDISAITRFSSINGLESWISISFDPKNNKWRQAFSDFSLRFFRNWRFHSLLNYDFILNKINNVDLYLMRDAGRFQLRFVWRSLSKQFLVELIPR